MKKKFVAIFILLIMLFAFGLTACSGETGDTHTHNWGAWSQTTAPTCTAEGIYWLDHCNATIVYQG